MKLIICLILSLNMYAENLQYEKPDNFDFLYNTDNNFQKVYKKITDKKNLWIWGGITASTLLLIKYDRELVNISKRLGKKLGISSKGGMKPVFDIAGFPIYIPSPLVKTKSKFFLIPLTQATSSNTSLAL